MTGGAAEASIGVITGESQAALNPAMPCLPAVASNSPSIELTAASAALVCCPLACLASWANPATEMPISNKMMPMTTSISINVNPRRAIFRVRQKGGYFRAGLDTAGTPVRTSREDRRKDTAWRGLLPVEPSTGGGLFAVSSKRGMEKRVPQRYRSLNKTSVTWTGTKDLFQRSCHNSAHGTVAAWPSRKTMLTPCG